MSSTLPSESGSGSETTGRSIARFVLLPFLVAAFIVVLIEVILWIAPIGRFEKSEASLIESTRDRIESGKNNYRVLILGDSRSMSLSPLGDLWDPPARPFPEVYNFSLPAMGTRYYLYFLKKYIEAGNRKPEAILFAGSPLLLVAGKGGTLVDPSLAGISPPDASLSEYLERRTLGRLARLSNEFKKRPERSSMSFEEVDWAFFSGRYTRMFSALEASRQYRGPERLFLVSASLPLYVRSYRYRDAILAAADPGSYHFSGSQHGTSSCTCERILEPACQAPPSHLEDNGLVEASRERTNGMYNISNRIPPGRRLEMEAAKEQLIARFSAQAATAITPDYSNVAEFLAYLKSENIRYFYVNLPFPSYFKNSPQLNGFDQSFAAFLATHPEAKRLYFPTEFIDPDFFADQVHLTCDGARHVNREFVDSVLPDLFSELSKPER